MSAMLDSSSAMALSSAVLETRLRQLRDQSNGVSQSLTQKLASSQSGQNLLHIGPSLSTLPPDLHSLLNALKPLVADVEKYEEANRSELGRIVLAGNEIRATKRRVDNATECAEMYGDLVAAEGDVRRDAVRKAAEGGESRRRNHGEDPNPGIFDDDFEEDLGKSPSLAALRHFRKLIEYDYSFAWLATLLGL